MKIKLILLFITSINYNIYSSIWLHIANDSESALSIYFADQNRVALKDSVPAKKSKYINTKWNSIETPYAIFEANFDGITTARYFYPKKMDTYAFIVENDQYHPYNNKNKILKHIKVKQRSQDAARTIVRDKKQPDKNDFALEISGAPMGAR